MADANTNLAINPRPPSYLAMLNEEIIIKICRHLDLYELLQIGELDINYQLIIGERIISKMKMFDIAKFSKHYDVRHAFKQFGKYVTALTVNEQSVQYKDNKYTFVQELFRLIQKRCAGQRLQTVSIIFDRDGPLNNESTGDMIPEVFEQIKTLIVCNCIHNREDVAQLLQTVLAKCLNLRKLRLTAVYGHTNYLLHSNWRTLNSLHFVRCQQIPWNFLLSGFPHLKSLKIDWCDFPVFVEHLNGISRITESIRRIATSFPQLNEFGLSKYAHSMYEAVCDGQPLGHFQMLKILSLDIPISANIFDVLATKNTIEKLSIGCKNLKEGYPSIRRLTNLRSVAFSVITDTNMPMIKEFLKLPLVSECSLNGYRVSENIISAVVASSPYLQTLKINNSKNSLKYTDKFYTNLATERQSQLPDQPLHLHARFMNLKTPMPSIVVHSIE